MPAPDFPHPVKLYSIAALRALEARGIAAAGGDPRALMVRAGQAGWRTVLEHWPRVRTLLVACGPGNNGGDGFELARNALQSGRAVTVIALPGAGAPATPAGAARAAWEEAGGRTALWNGELPEAGLVVDALFGIGLCRPLEGEAAQLVDAINRLPVPVLSLDVPSGVDAATGAASGPAVVADHTLEFIAPKAGLRTGAARGLSGGLSLDGLQVEPGPVAIGATAECLGRDALRRWLRPRERDSHKGRHGRVLCIGGDHGYGGAVMLAAEAALRSGAGRVDVLTRPLHVAPLLARLPEAMVHGCDGARPDPALLASADVIAIGPGLGREPWGAGLLEAAMAAGKPLVLDADGLNLLARAPAVLPRGSVITPHPGEAARLLGCSTGEVQGDRFGAVDALARHHGVATVLKGAGSLVAAPGRLSRLVDAGNPGLAVGGTGDVLTGVVAALLAQGLEAFDAAAAGALMHAAAGDLAAADGERGLLPGDLMPALRRLANPEPA
ncbi:NAD(P)H-hydrate dehydratase [Lysobacter sp. GX 14042]|uniref:NAD(P)H-hydrate dehydratase n=1 Tax=Lysobacter sp. GX 14042 TaxID=2907155 RepID=UPI001F306D1A|nr:NAD(P)H-hydrate dehydratase [Lysobacter sp. GX 14042]MCE7032643.1 NAD(P)H-hydrate dehydratase [Lysobacter sp. GX 14042]